MARRAQEPAAEYNMKDGFVTVAITLRGAFLMAPLGQDVPSKDLDKFDLMRWMLAPDSLTVRLHHWLAVGNTI